jgi:hypothetical protein
MPSVGFVFLTLILPAAFWWCAVRTEWVEFHWAVVLFGITVVAFGAVLYGISPSVWHFEGREGYVADILNTYSQSIGIVGVALDIGLGMLIGEGAAAIVKRVRQKVYEDSSAPFTPPPPRV